MNYATTSGNVVLRRRLRAPQIFFICLGGVVGIGFFRGSSANLAVSGPAGALIATLVVGVIAIIVMEAICELINIWPIPNAMVEYVKVFIDEDLGIAIGILYWYTYCITFSAIVIAAGDLADYWAPQGQQTIDFVWKSVIYACVPWLLLIINCAPVKYFGWIEFVGGILKVALIIGTVLLMICINAGVGYDEPAIGSRYFKDAIQNNPKVAASHTAAVFISIPSAIFAYIGVELLTTTAFEARDPRELRFPARNLAWITTMLYGLATGCFVANVWWKDPQLPTLFSHAVKLVTNPTAELPIIRPDAHAAPLIVLIRLGFKTLPSLLNGCFIYSALSCANTALYVSSRQLYGLTRAITIDSSSGPLRRFFGWMGSVEHRTRTPWPAIFISMLFTYWLPFIRAHEQVFIRDVQGVLDNIGSVSCILVWCSQCIAYILFFHWRDKHDTDLKSRIKYQHLWDLNNTGWLRVGQPYLSYIGAIATFLTVFFFNTASMWTGQDIIFKATGAFISPVVLLCLYLIKKFTRPRNQWTFFKNLSDWTDFEREIQYLEALVFPLETQDDGSSEKGDIRKGVAVVVSERPESQALDADVTRRNVFTRGDLNINTQVPSSSTTTDPYERRNSISPLPIQMDTLSPQDSRGYNQQLHSHTHSNSHSHSHSHSPTQSQSSYLQLDFLSASPHDHGEYSRGNLSRQISEVSAISAVSQIDGTARHELGSERS